MKKMSRGSIETAKSSDGIQITRWKDNQVVTVLSTRYGSHPIAKTRRWSKEQTQHIMVDRPNAIMEYNLCMGGTDRLNQMVNKYRVGIQGKKFYFPIFTWLIDVSLNNAWRLSRMTGTQKTFLDFRRDVANFYLKSFGVPPRKYNFRIL